MGIVKSPLRHVEGQSEEHITRYGAGHKKHLLNPYSDVAVYKGSMKDIGNPKKRVTDIAKIMELTGGEWEEGKMISSGQYTIVPRSYNPKGVGHWEPLSGGENWDPIKFPKEQYYKEFYNEDKFGSTKEGNKFRAFVNQFDKKWAQTKVPYKSGETEQLSLKGSRKNKFIADAYKIYGEEYENYSNLPSAVQKRDYGFSEEIDIDKLKRKIPDLTYDFKIDGLQLTDKTFTVIDGKSVTMREWIIGKGLLYLPGTFTKDQIEEGRLNSTKIKDWKNNNKSLIEETEEEYNKNHKDDLALNSSLDGVIERENELLNISKEEIIQANITAVKIEGLDLTASEVEDLYDKVDGQIEDWKEHLEIRDEDSEMFEESEGGFAGFGSNYNMGYSYEEFINEGFYHDDMKHVALEAVDMFAKDPVTGGPLHPDDREAILFNGGDESYFTLEAPDGSLRYFHGLMDYDAAINYQKDMLKHVQKRKKLNKPFQNIDVNYNEARRNIIKQILREKGNELTWEEVDENLDEQDPRVMEELRHVAVHNNRLDLFEKKVNDYLTQNLFTKAEGQGKFEIAGKILYAKLEKDYLKLTSTYELAIKQTNTLSKEIKRISKELKSGEDIVRMKEINVVVKGFNKEVEALKTPDKEGVEEKIKTLTTEYEGDLLEKLGSKFKYQWQVDLINKRVSELVAEHEVEVATYNSKVNELREKHGVSSEIGEEYDRLTKQYQDNVERHTYLSKKLNFQSEVFDGMIEDFEELEMDEAFLSAFMKDIGLNHAKGTILAVDTGLSIVNFVSGLEEMVYQIPMLAVDPIADWYAGEDVDIGSLTGRNHLKTWIYNANQWRHENIAAGPTYEDLTSGKISPLYYGAYLVGNNLPTMVTMAVTTAFGVPQVGLSIMAASQTGNKWQDMARDGGWDGKTSFSGIYGNEYNFGEWYGTLGAWYTVSYFSERIMLGQANKFNIGRQSLFANQKGIFAPIKRNIFTNRNLAITGVDIFEGATQEGVDTFLKNTTDIWFLGKDDVSYGDGMGESILSGGVLSGMYKTPLLLQNIKQIVTSKSSDQKISEKTNRVAELGKLLQQENITKEDIDIYQAEQQKLFNEINDIVFKDIKRVDLFSAEEKQNLINISNLQFDLKSQARDLSESDTKTVKQKQKELENLKEQYNALQNTKEEIINQFSDEVIEENYEQQETDRVAKEKREDKNQESIYEKIKKGVINHQAFDESNIVISEQENDLDTREAWEMVVNQDIAYLESQIEEGDLNIQEIQNIQNEIDKLKSTITDIHLESSEFGTSFGLIYNSVATGQKVIIVNKSRVKEGGEGEYVLKHEWLHNVTNDVIYNTNFESETIAGQELFQYIKQEYNKQGHEKPFEETTFFRRLLDYEKDAKGIPQPDVQASEVFTLLSDAFSTGDIPYNSKNTTLLDKIKGNVNEMLVSVGLKDLKLKTAEDLYNFVKTYNESIEKGGKGREARIIDKAIIEGKRIEREEQEARIQHSKNVQQEIIIKPDLKTDFDNFVQKPDRTKKYETKEDFQQSVDFFPAYDMVVNSKKLDGLVMANVSDVIQPTQMSEFVNK